MLALDKFVVGSMDLNLFFLRIMKEHALFLQLGFTPRNHNLAAEAAAFGRAYTCLLEQAAGLANGNVSEAALGSHQFITQYTLRAEQKTQYYTGVQIQSGITMQEALLSPFSGMLPAGVVEGVQALNGNAYQLTVSFIGFKRRLLEEVRNCRIFTVNYPLIYDHMLCEAERYIAVLSKLMTGREFSTEELADRLAFWNNIMSEDTEFTAGLLDASEKELIKKAWAFGEEFQVLSQTAAASKMPDDIGPVVAESIRMTKELQAFNEAGTSGILNCKVLSIILPLLADHVFRETNYYLCILGVCDQTT